MTYYCPHTPTVKLTDKSNSKYIFNVCDTCKTDPDFSKGFSEEQI